MRGAAAARAYTRASVGRSQAVRQRVLVPRSQVRILAPQPSIPIRVSDTPIAAVVLAAGLGTRMRSAVPKHLHPLLGRRMVDWVILAAEGVGADPLVVVASPADERRLRRGRGRGPAEPLGTGDALRAARAALEGRSRACPRALGRRRPPHRRDAPRARSPRTVETGARRRPSSGSSTTTRATTAGSSAMPTGMLARIVEATRRDAGASSRSARRTRRSTSSGRISSGRRSTCSSPTTRRVSCTSPTRSGCSSTPARPSRSQVAPEAFEAGVNTRAELADAIAVPPRPHQPARTCSPGVTIVDPDCDLDRAGGRDRARRDDPPLCRSSAARPASRSGAEIQPHTVVVDAEVGPGANVGPFCYLRPGTVLEAELEGRYLRGDQELTHRAEGEGAAPVVHRRRARSARARISAPARSRPTSRTRPGCPKSRTRIGKNVRTGIQNGFIAPVEVGDGAWTAAGSIITKDVPPDALAVARARQENKEGYAARHRDD